jgi:diacylglycerol kinase
MQRLWASFGFAFAGLRYLFKTQPNARIHVATTVAVLIVGVWLKLAARDWAVLVVTAGAVFVAEGFNTALEAAVDLVSPQPHPLARIAKDVSAGAVTLAAASAVVVGLLILGPPLYVRLFE